MLLRAFVICVISVLGLVQPAAAFRTAADAAAFPDDVVVRWRTARISVGFDEAPDASAASDLASAAEAWSMVACSEIEFVVGDAHPTVEIFYVDDWAARGLDANAIATTDLSYRGGDDEWWIAGAQILLDRARLADSAEVDLRAVLTHELGHVLGLWHVCEPSDGVPCSDAQRSSALFPVHSLTQRMLAPDDVAGACFLYPVACVEDCGCEGEGCAWLGDPCGTDIAECSYGECAVDGYCSLGCEAPGDCPRGEACEAGLCIATTSRRYGEACDFGADCASLLCVSRGADGMCTRGCDGMACPAEDECVLVEGRAVCMTPNSGGCSASGVGGDAGSWMAFLLACLFTRGRWRMR